MPVAAAVDTSKGVRTLEGNVDTGVLSANLRIKSFGSPVQPTVVSTIQVRALVEFRPPPSKHICGGVSPWGGTGMSRRPKSVPPGPKNFLKAPLRGAS